MDEDRISGTARKLGGKVQEEVGRFTDDTQTQIKGMANQAAGTAQDLYGQATDAARDTAATFDKWLRNTIETQPYATAIVAPTWTALRSCLREPTRLLGEAEPHSPARPAMLGWMAVRNR